MPSRNPSATYKLGSLVTLMYHYRISNSSHPFLGYNHGLWISRPLGYGSSMHQGHRLFSASNAALYRKYNQIDMLKEDNEKVQVQTPVPAPPKPVPAPPKPNFSFSTNWAKWFVGSILSLLLPFMKQKWDNLLKLEGNLEKAAEEVVYVAEVVEKVAATAEKVSAEVADKLPGNVKLKQTALMVEHISSMAASDAQLAEDFIDKVGKLKQDFEALEKIVEPVIDQIEEVKHG